MRTLTGLGLAIVLAATPAVQSAGQPAKGPYRGRIVPFCPGLKIVTAISQPTGDYESIKQVESATAAGVRIKYSSYMPDPKGDYDSDSTPPPPYLPYHVFRTVRTADLDDAPAYMQQFGPIGIPETVKGTTAVGISRKLYNALKQTAPVPITVFMPVIPGSAITDTGEPAGIFDYRSAGEIARVEPQPVMLTVLVNDRPTPLPAVHAKGAILGEVADFYFLDDPDNPLALKFRIGRDRLQVIKLSWSCGGGVSSTDASPAGDGGGGAGGGGTGGAGAGSGAGGGRASARGPGPGSGAGAGGGAAAAAGAGGGAGAQGESGAAFIERSLAERGRVDIYSVYFAFNSDVIRDESAETLQNVAAVLKKHPDWKLSIDGHTDNVASDSFNLDLSRRRAAAVKSALVKAHAIDGTHLSTAGFGEGRPKTTNETIEGRAQNRRVELVKLP